MCPFLHFTQSLETRLNKVETIQIGDTQRLHHLLSKNISYCLNIHLHYSCSIGMYCMHTGSITLVAKTSWQLDKPWYTEQVYKCIVSFPGAAQLSVACWMEKHRDFYPMSTMQFLYVRYSKWPGIYLFTLLFWAIWIKTCFLMWHSCIMKPCLIDTPEKRSSYYKILWTLRWSQMHLNRLVYHQYPWNVGTSPYSVKQTGSQFQQFLNCTKFTQ